MYLEEVKSQERYIFMLNMEYFIMTNTRCSKCFNKEYNHKVDRFILITGDEIDEWMKVVAVYLPIKDACKCV